MLIRASRSCARCAGRRVNATIDRDVEAGDTGFIEGRKVGYRRQAGKRGDREAFELTRLYLRKEVDHQVDHDLHFATHEANKRGTAAPVRHMNDIDAGRVLELGKHRISPRCSLPRMMLAR